MKRLIIDVDPDATVAELPGGGVKVFGGLCGGGTREVLLHVDGPWFPQVAVEDVPDPLPTTPGTHIVATVRRYASDGCYPESERTVCALMQVAGELWWRSALPVRNEVMHKPEHLSDWSVLNLPDPEVQS